MDQAAASRAILNEAIELINAGKRDKADAICRDAIQRNPNDVNITALLGASLLKAGEMGEAEEFLRRAIQLAPSFAKPHEDLGYLLVEQGRPEEALPILNTATRLEPSLERAHLYLGKALTQLVTNYEIGTKTTWADGRFQFNLTAYHMIWDDMQIEAEDPTPNIFTLGLVNLAEAEINGAEAFVSWVPMESMWINASIGYNDGGLSKTSVLFEGTDTELVLDKGSPLPLVPDWKASVSLDYEFNGELLGSTPTLSITYNYTGDSLSSLAGIASTEVLNPVRVQDAYSLTNLRFGLENDSWSATLFIHNAFDEYARQYYNDRWIQTRLLVNQPRTYGITFRKNFQ